MLVFFFFSFFLLLDDEESAATIEVKKTRGLCCQTEDRTVMFSVTLNIGTKSLTSLLKDVIHKSVPSRSSNPGQKDGVRTPQLLPLALYNCQGLLLKCMKHDRFKLLHSKHKAQTNRRSETNVSQQTANSR